jgi:hypothetical protein
MTLNKASIDKPADIPHNPPRHCERRYAARQSIFVQGMDRVKPRWKNWIASSPSAHRNDAGKIFRPYNEQE